MISLKFIEYPYPNSAIDEQVLGIELLLGFLGRMPEGSILFPVARGPSGKHHHNYGKSPLLQGK